MEPTMSDLIDLSDFAESGAIAGIFGDGTHPTTRLASAALATCARDRRVLDVGTGTGVLVRAALAAGASFAVGIDHDRRAVDTARALTPREASFFRAADAREYLEQVAGGAFDVVVANLPDPFLSSLAAPLATAARPGGTLIVTGILLWQAEPLAAALTAAGARVTSRRAEAGWALLVAAC
jgi:ribosomal protein L11 methyltransferase